MTIRERFKALPRAGQWLVWFVLVIAVYFGVVEPVLGYAGGVRDRADRLQRTLDAQAKLSIERAQAGGLIERGLLVMGLPNAPTNAGDPLDALNRRIDRLAREHNVVIKRRTERTNAPVAGNADWNGQKLEQVGVEFAIECDTNQLVAVLKDLEGAPEVHAVTQMRVQKINSGPGKEDLGVLNVTLLPVTWVLPKEGAK